MVYLRVRAPLHSQESPVKGSAGKELSASAPCLFTETDVVEDPQEMLHHRSQGEKQQHSCFFLGQDIAVEPPKKPGPDVTGISATSEAS